MRQLTMLSGLAVHVAVNLRSKNEKIASKVKND